MGVWGAGLYDNDSTSDIRDAFQNLYNNGIHPTSAAEIIRQEFASIFSDSEEGPLVELALREQLFLCGHLHNKGLSETLSFLENGGDLANWEMSHPKLIEQRREELARLVLLFSSVPPKTTKLTKGALKTKINWTQGQVFAVPICKNAEISTEYQYGYILLYVHGEAEKVDRYHIPEVYVKLCKKGELPRNAEEFNKLEYVQISCTAMKDRFRPFKRIEDVPTEYQQQYIPDSWGYLPEYSMVIYEADGIHPPDSMIYLGQMDNISPPSYSYRKYRALNGAAWDYLQEFVLQCYCLHNLRQAKFYKENDGRLRMGDNSVT